MSSSLAIPSVTEDDLRAFHAKHFPGLPPPKTFFVAAGGSSQAEEEETDDGLGYYPDGVKRTLTDEQIGIFRHSEVQRILKAIGQKREREGSPAASTPTSQATSVANTSESTESQARTGKRQLRPDSIGYASRNLHSKRQKKFQHRDERRAVQYDAEIKAYIGKKEEFISDEGMSTYRRMARDLDEQQAENVELDY